jgi:hypothetical protein
VHIQEHRINTAKQKVL